MPDAIRLGATPRIAIVKTSSMGDVIHALPVVTDILQSRPQAQIHWVVEEGFADLPALHPGVQSVHRVALRRWRKSWQQADTRAQLRAARSALAALELDCVLDLQGLVKSAWISTWMSGRRAGFSWSCARESLASLFYQKRYSVQMKSHAIERGRELAAAALGHTYSQPPRFCLRAPSATATLAAVLGSGATPYRVFLHATSRAEKQWPIDHWVAMLRDTEALGYRAFLPFGSEAERAAANDLVKAAGVGEVLPRLGLADCAALLSQARGVVGVDTGLTHLAAALDAPTVALFAATPAWRFGPYWSPHCVSLGEDGVWPEAKLVARTLLALEPS